MSFTFGEKSNCLKDVQKVFRMIEGMNVSNETALSLRDNVFIGGVGFVILRERERELIMFVN